LDFVPTCDTIIRNVRILDGSGREPQAGGVSTAIAIQGDRIHAIGKLDDYNARQTFDGNGNVLAPGFIDAHTHDDICVIDRPVMLPKLSQGVTTVVVGNCGISAAPVQLSGALPDPMNLLGSANVFLYPTFAAYADAVNASRPAVNVAALVGHTSLRNNHMDRLDRVATAGEISAMTMQLREALDHGALGLSTGLAYLSASSASTEEVMALANPLSEAGAIYTTHLRSETQAVLEAMLEAFSIGRHAKVPVVISHLKCAGIDNWGRSQDVLRTLENASDSQSIGCDCYPYAASSSTLDLRQVDERVMIMITWSEPHPEVAGQTLAEIAGKWSVPQVEAAKRLQPAGAIYHGMSEDDVCAILRHPATMIGSDGLPNDPRPHPRLWGTFPRVLGYYSREQRLFSLSEAVRKMTGLPAQRFGFKDRGLVREGYIADLVLFDPETVRDLATFTDPIRAAAGIEAVWVNGVLSYKDRAGTGERAGRFLRRHCGK
jgi:N-acyl-D-aspartate/D-glutamate deacylase